MNRQDICNRALALVGTRFRIGGRDRAGGLDCIGLAAMALGRELPLPSGYRLQGASADRWHRWFDRHQFIKVKRASEPGDLVLVRAGPVQFHLLIAVPDGFVHAHAGLRHVVFLPGDPLWPIVSVWRAPFISGD